MLEKKIKLATDRIEALWKPSFTFLLTGLSIPLTIVLSSLIPYYVFLATVKDKIVKISDLFDFYIVQISVIGAFYLFILFLFIYLFFSTSALYNRCHSRLTYMRNVVLEKRKLNEEDVHFLNKIIQEKNLTFKTLRKLDKELSRNAKESSSSTNNGSLLQKLNDLVMLDWGKFQFVKISIILSFLIIYSFLGFIAFKYLIGLFFGTHIFSWASLLVGIILIILFHVVLVFFVKESIQTVTKTLQLKSKTKPYLIIAITCIISFLILGFSLISEEYKSTFPLETKLSDHNKANSNSKLICSSMRGKSQVIVGDILRCSGEIVPLNTSILEEHSEFRSYIIVQKYPSLETERVSLNSCSKILNTSIKLEDCRYPVNSTDYHILYFHTSFNDMNSERILFKYKGIRVESISEESYRGKNKDRITMIFILVSLSLFSVLSGTSNLKNIIEER